MTSRGLSVTTAQPYPWPYDGAAAAGRTALWVVAAQEGLVSRCAAVPAALFRIGELVEAARAWGATVVATRHAASPALRRPGLLPAIGTEGWRLVGGGPGGDASDEVIDAYGIDAFSGSPLADYLAGQGLDHLLLCGLGLEGPVHSTMRSANDRGLECLLVTDACASLDPSVAGAAVRMIEMSGGIFGSVAPSSDVLAAVQAVTSLFPPLEV